MSPSFNSFGSLPSISQLLWDTDLIIPEGKAIESASGEVEISGDVSVSGSLSADNTVQGVEELTSALVTATSANITTPTLNGKNMKLILIPLNTPITKNSSASSFTVVNPYSTNVAGNITATGGTGTDSNYIRLDGKIIDYVSPGQTKSINITLTPGTHTISQNGNHTITLNAGNFTFYAFN